MPEDLDRSAQLIERLLTDHELRAQFRADPASVLEQNGLDGLADGLPAGPRGLMTLELRESRSSLAGVMVAAAAEGVDVGHLAEHALPRLGRDAGRAVSHVFRKLSTHSHKPVTHAKPGPVAPAQKIAPKAKPELAPVQLPTMAQPVHHQAATGAEAAPHVAEAAVSTHVDPLQYPGTNASSQQIAHWMGANAQQAGLPPELPVMAALTESGLRNLDYGDRDSVGFFQMRSSIWNEGPYAGYLQNPELQMKWFIDEALSVRRSDPSLADSPASYGDWVADVERPAAEYRYRYQLQLANAQDLLRNANLSATSPMAADLQGADYVRAVFVRNGMKLPGNLAEQFDVGASVPRDALRPGDAVFFGSANGTPAVVGIYAGDGKVTMGSDGRLETIAQLASGRHYIGARRYTEKLLTGASSYARVLPTIKP
jgi:hypothetical protein